MAEHKKSILLVEDNLLVKKISVIILENLNCKVDAVISGQEAILLADLYPFDVIFMDIGLPDMDGCQVISHIRKHSRLNKRTRIVVLSAHSDTGYRNKAYEEGADEFLVKPLNYEVGRMILQRYSSSHIAETYPGFCASC